MAKPLVLALLLALTMALTTGGCRTARDNDTAPFTVVTYNIHGGGPIAKTPAAKAALREARAGRTMWQWLADELRTLDADIVALQEVPNAKFGADLAKAAGMHVAFFPGGWRGRGWPDGIAAAILSRHPIRAQQSCPLARHETRPKDLFTRGYGKVVIDRGSGDNRAPIAIYVAHLLPAWKNTTHIREGEIREIAASVANDRAAGRSVLVLGDMNHHPAMPEYPLWNKNGLVDTVAATAAAGDQRTCPATGPTERIDFVFVAGPLHSRLTRASRLFGAPWCSTSADEFALSDHVPVVATFR